MAEPALRRTPLHDLHQSLGAKMVPFAGYDMPVQYPAGIMAEHLHTRAKAGLVRRLAYGPGAARRRRCGGGARDARAGRHRRRWRRGGCATRSSPTSRGGILDDLMVTNAGDHLLRRRQRRAQGRTTSPICAAISAAERRSTPLRRPRAARAARAGGGRACWRGFAPGVDGMAFMTGGAIGRRRRSPASSRAPAIPARTGSRSRCRRAPPSAWRGACWRSRK